MKSFAHESCLNNYYIFITVQKRHGRSEVKSSPSIQIGQQKGGRAGWIMSTEEEQQGYQKINGEEMKRSHGPEDKRQETKRFKKTKGNFFLFRKLCALSTQASCRPSGTWE
jgi:hypothetical protein